MKICHITTVHRPLDIRIFQKECKSLLAAGYEVVLIAQHDRDEVIDGIQIVSIRKSKSRINRMIFSTFRVFILALKEKAALYHFHDPELIPASILLKIFSRSAIIYDVHEDYAKQKLAEEYIPKIFRKPISILIQLIERVSSRFFDGIVTATDNILQNFNFHNNRISVRNFPIIAEHNIDQVKKRKNNKFNIIYVGGLTEIRGITQIVKSLEFFNKNDKIQLILCGNFSSNKYENKIRKLKGFSKVDYKGWVLPKEAKKNLSESDLGIVCFLPLPNHINAMPNKIFEYMASGLPIIGSDFPLWKEIIERNNCGLCVNPLNPEEISKAIKYLKDSPSKRKKMGGNGRKSVIKKYNWEMESKKLINLYNNLLNHKKIKVVNCSKKY